MKTIIVITGADGAGKDTQCAFLNKYLKSKGVESDICNPKEIWLDLITELNCSKEQWDHFLKKLSPLTRLSLILLSIKETLNRTSSQYIIINSYWYKYLAMELAIKNDNLVENFFKLLNAIHLPKPHFVFYLNPSSEIRLLRKTTLTSYECGFLNISSDNFMRHQKNVEKKFIDILPKNTITITDTNSSPEYILNQITDQLKSTLSTYESPILER